MDFSFTNSFLWWILTFFILLSAINLVAAYNLSENKNLLSSQEKFWGYLGVLLIIISFITYTFIGSITQIIGSVIIGNIIGIPMSKKIKEARLKYSLRSILLSKDKEP